MKKILSLLLILFSLQAFGQNTHDEIIQNFLEQRKRMMEDIMKAFDDDEFFQDDFFQDDMFKALRQHGLGGFKGFNGVGDNIRVEEKMQKDGTISVVITPQNEKTDLNIETTDDRITIKSQMKVEEENVQGKARSKSISMQSFSRSIAIPEGYVAKTPKKEGKSIVISLVPQEGNILKPDEDGRVPIKAAPGEAEV